MSDEGTVMPTLGICSLAAVAREAGFSTAIIDSTPAKLGLEGTVSAILAYAPRYVGMTATTDVMYNAAAIATRVKEIDPSIICIIGGPHITAAPSETMERYPAFTYGVFGEGEDTIVDLLQTLKEKRDVGHVKGLLYMDKERLIRTGQRPFIADLDTLPFPAWDLLPDLATGYRPAVVNYKQLPSTSLVTSRGCPAQCTFCDTSVFGQKFRGFSAPYMIRTVEHLEDRHGIRDISMYDDVFTTNNQRLNSFCGYLADRKRARLTWNCEARVNLVNYEMMKMMHDAGCWKINFGIESGSQAILDHMKKHVTVEKNLQTISDARRAGLEVEAYMILGYLTETEETIAQTIDFIKRAELDYILLNFFIPFPGSEAWGQAPHFGQFDDNWENMDILGKPKFIPRGLDEERLVYYHRKIYRTHYFKPHVLKRYVTRAMKPSETIRLLSSAASFAKFVFGADKPRDQKSPARKILSNGRNPAMAPDVRVWR